MPPVKWSTATTWSCSTEGRGRGRGGGNPAKYADTVSSSQISPMIDLARRSQVASRVLARASSDARDEALGRAADLLEERTDRILEANVVDVGRAEASGADATALDRLRLDTARLAAMAGGLRKVAGLPDPVGEVVDGWVRPNGLRIERVRVPLGVVGIIYENRPNVTSDAAGLCLKSGNAVLLRGSSSAVTSNLAIAAVLKDGLAKAGLPVDAVGLVADTEPVVGGGLHAAPRADRLPDPTRWALAGGLDPRARHGALRDRRRGQLPRLRGPGRRPRHGRVDRGQRQDAPAGRVQQRGDPPRPPGGGRRLPAQGGRGPRPGSPCWATRRPDRSCPAWAVPPRRTSPPSSWASP